MAIYGAGSLWGNIEKKAVFFSENKFILGWNDECAKDLYEAIASLKTGDIIYLKSNAPGSRTIRVKGIGIIVKSVMQCILDNEYSENINDWESLFVKINWLCKEEFIIEIEPDEGKLTNVRAGSFYEEFLPFVQNEILLKLFKI